MWTHASETLSNFLNVNVKKKHRFQIILMSYHQSSRLKAGARLLEFTLQKTLIDSGGELVQQFLCFMCIIYHFFCKSQIENQKKSIFFCDFFMVKNDKQTARTRTPPHAYNYPWRQRQYALSTYIKNFFEMKRSFLTPTLRYLSYLRYLPYPIHAIYPIHATCATCAAYSTASHSIIATQQYYYTFAQFTCCFSVVCVMIVLWLFFCCVCYDSTCAFFLLWVCYDSTPVMIVLPL